MIPVSVSSVAGQPPCPYGPGNQNRAVRPPIASVRGKTDRDDPSGELGPNMILEGSRSGRKTPRLPGLFQPASRSLGLKGTAARSRGCGCAAKLCFVPVAEALSRTVSDAYRSVISGFAKDTLEIPRPTLARGPFSRGPVLVLCDFQKKRRLSFVRGAQR